MAIIAKDTFPNDGLGAQDSARKAFAITPSDTDELAFIARAIHVGADGDVVAILQGDTAAVTFTCKAGTCLPYRVRQVKSTGTTATGLVAVY